MEEQFGQAKEKRKRILFLESMIRDRNEEISSLQGEIASLRKKNGRAVKAEVDILIYQINKKIDALGRSVEECKEEIKKTKGEIADLLSLCYAATEKEEEREKIESLMSETFGGKARLVSNAEAGGIFGKCKIVSAVTTTSKKNRLRISRMIKAGVVTDAGKYLSYPEIEVYDYTKKGLPGVRRAETDDFKRKLEKSRHGEKYYYAEEIFAQKRNFFLALVTAVLFVALSFVAGYVFPGELFGKRFAVFSLIFVAVFAAGLFSCLYSAKRGCYADHLAAVAFPAGIGGAVLAFVLFRLPILAIVPLGAAAVGLAFTLSRFAARKRYSPCDNEAVVCVSALAYGLLFAEFLLLMRENALSAANPDHSGLIFCTACVWISAIMSVLSCIAVIVRLYGKKRVRGASSLFFTAHSLILFIGTEGEILLSSVFLSSAVFCLILFVTARLRSKA